MTNELAGKNKETEALSGSAIKDQKKSSVKGEDPHGIRNIPFLLEFLENHLPFTATLIGVVGYIFIATFGEMNDWDKFWRYVSFLVLMFIVYKGLKWKSKKQND